MTELRGRALLAAGAVVRRGEGVLMVRQQGPRDPTASWGFPGGVVEPGELLDAAVARELFEESGLRCLSVDRLAYLVQIEGGETMRSLVCMFEVTAEDGEPRCDDPDELVDQACFVPVDEAIRRLGQVAWTPMREPPVAYLSGRGAATTWLYRGSGPPVVVPA